MKGRCWNLTLLDVIYLEYHRDGYFEGGVTSLFVSVLPCSEGISYWFLLELGAEWCQYECQLEQLKNECISLK